MAVCKYLQCGILVPNNFCFSFYKFSLKKRLRRRLAHLARNPVPACKAFLMVNFLTIGGSRGRRQRTPPNRIQLFRFRIHFC